MEENINEMSYEEAFSKMKDILARLEEGNENLDQSLKLYEEGIKLYRHCSRVLNDAELKIKKYSIEDEKEVEFDGI